MPATPKSPIASLFKINLLREKRDALTSQARFTRWLFTLGRFLVIAVELFVIAAFVYRYQLDAKLSDLDDNIRRQVDLLKSMQGTEREIRQVQYQLSSIKITHNANPAFSQTVRSIAQMTPKNISLRNVTYSKTADTSANTLKLAGNSPTTIELAAFIRQLKRGGSFKDVALTNLTYEENLSFSISVSPSNQEEKSSAI